MVDIKKDNKQVDIIKEDKEVRLSRRTKKIDIVDQQKQIEVQPIVKEVSVINQVEDLEISISPTDLSVINNPIAVNVVNHPIFVPYTVEVSTAGGTLEAVTDGITTVNDVTVIKFIGAEVRSDGTIAEVEITGGSGGSGNIDNINTELPILWEEDSESLSLVYGEEFEVINGALRLYKAPILTLGADIVREVGIILAQITINWTLNKTVMFREFTAGPLLGINVGAGSSGSYTHTDANLMSNTIYTLRVEDDRNIVSDSLEVKFTHRRFWGTNSKLILEDIDIANLSSELAFNRTKVWNQNGLGEYIYYAYPSSWGATIFRVNGLINTAWELTQQTYTNSYGVVTLYNVYRTTVIQFGTLIAIDAR